MQCGLVEKLQKMSDLADVQTNYVTTETESNFRTGKLHLRNTPSGGINKIWVLDIPWSAEKGLHQSLQRTSCRRLGRKILTWIKEWLREKRRKITPGAHCANRHLVKHLVRMQQMPKVAGAA